MTSNAWFGPGIAAVTAIYVNGESKSFSAAIRPNSMSVGGQVAQQAGSMAVVPDNGKPLSPQAVTDGDRATAVGTFLPGMVIYADSSAGSTGPQLYTAIGAGNLRAYVQGQDDRGGAALAN
jgi:hypothetical protein